MHWWILGLQSPDRSEEQQSPDRCRDATTAEEVGSVGDHASGNNTQNKRINKAAVDADNNITRDPLL